MLHRIARLALRSPRRILALAALLTALTAVFGLPVANHLSAGGFQDPGSESARAAALLSEKFGQSDQQLLITVTDPAGATGEAARAAGIDIVTRLDASPHVLSVSSPWTSPPAAAAELLSRDGDIGLIVATLAGGEDNAPRYAAELAGPVVGDRDGVTIRAGGTAMIYDQINQQTKHDLLRMEAIAIPLSFLVLVWVFGGVVAASLPMLVGVLAILGAMSVLRLITAFAEVSIFALNITAALGLALAIDYTLLIVSRYRDEIALGAEPEAALVRTMCTAGRTVLFSAVTVALSLSALLLFPMYFLKSFAYSGIATVAFAAAAAVIVTPAAIVALGSRLDAFDIRRLVRRVLRRPQPADKPVQRLFWYRSTKFVMRRSIPIGTAIVALLLLLGAPFLGIEFGSPDDRVLPRSASAHQVGDQLRNDFASDLNTGMSVVIPEATGATEAELSRYAADLSRVPEVTLVSAPGGTFAGGNRVGPPSAPAGAADGSVFLSVRSTAPLFSQDSRIQLDRLHAVAEPAGREVLIGGVPQINRDIVGAVTSRMPLVLSLIGVITFVLLFLLTGSLVLPLKALVLNVLSLSAAFGALVWVFQEGHLGALGTTPTGTMEANVPVLMFCVAFGLSMDYEVFLLARIREYWLESPRTRQDSDESVALGLARTGRVVTAAALIMAIAFAALIAAQVSFMRIFGLGLTLAVLADATLVRMALLPAFMHVMGRWNWWAPGPLVRLHERIGLSEGPPDRPPASPESLATVGK
ncbi:MMPL family transporter [Mycolicibacterium sp.]|uniref:MMPL family transporter n=1 Tax=Mycolicibacterium sp. TaxID=2320850 RepID=UPI001D526AE2|nr:MMPL family transporter [Mycolicibacterium sp.]MCB1291348.1 MMPL family transporter [Mycobacterium sp.]MCB9410902.1 MMPL family transporter [Mycolicibacterium sp.]